MPSNPKMLTMRSAAALFGWKKPGNTKEFFRRTGLRPVGVVGRAAVYDEEAVKALVASRFADAAKESAANTPDGDGESTKLAHLAHMTHLNHQRMTDMCKQVNSISLRVEGLSTVVEALRQEVKDGYTNASAGYNVVADELNKIKLQLVEYAPKA